MKYLGVFLCGLVLGAGAWMLLHDLGVGPLVQYDEGTYAQVVHESLERRDFLTFTYFGNLFFDKPPLYFWLAGVATILTGDEVLGIRLPAALAALATIVLVIYIVVRLTKSNIIGAVAGAYLVSVDLFIQGAREARLDSLMALFILLAFWAAWERKYIWWGLWVGLAVLTKSVVGIFAFAALPIVVLWGREYQGLPLIRLWQGVALTVLLALPWHLYEWAMWGSQFWFSYINVNILQRYSSNLFADPNLQTDYWARLLDYARPELALFVFAVVAALCLRHPRYNKLLGSALSLMVFMIFIFFTAQTRALPYLIPLYPLATLVLGVSASLFLQRCRGTVGHDTHESLGSTG